MERSVVKTRMQALEARTQYRNAFHCAYRVFNEEGLRQFWRGTTPRLARLVVSTGCYDRASVLTTSADEWRDHIHGVRAGHLGNRWA
jgi:hypothetical protein